MPLIILVTSTLALYAPVSVGQTEDYYFIDSYLVGPHCGVAVGRRTDKASIGQDCSKYYLNPATGGDTCTVNRLNADPPRGPGWACKFTVSDDPTRNAWVIKDVHEDDGTLYEVALIQYVCDGGGRIGDDNVLNCQSYIDKKNAGARADICCIKNPINPFTRNKYVIETDYAGAGTHPLLLQRYYNSNSADGSGRFGLKWRHTFDRSISLSGTKATAARPDGKEYVFTQSGPNWIAEADVMDSLNQIPGGWSYTAAPDEEVETYDATGRLASIANRAGVTHTLSYDVGGRLAFVTHSLSGKALSFSYDVYGRITAITDPATQTFGYAYDAFGNLSTVTYPSDILPNPVRTYLYNEPANTSGQDLPSYLTGIIDENSSRFSTYKYSANGRAISSEHAGGVFKHSVTYSGGTATVTDPLNKTRNFGSQKLFNVYRPTGVDQPCNGCGVGSSATYDANGYLSGATDFNNVQSTYVHDARGLQISRVEAFATPQARTTSTEWHATFRLPTRVAEPLRITTNVYDADGTQCGARGALCSRTIQATNDANGSQAFSATPVGAPRTWSYTYNANGSVLTIDGPRIDASDVTTYTYYANDDADLGKRGNVASVTNAAGHTTNITAYNAHGQPLTIVDANGLTTTLAYDARQRLTSRTVGGEATTYDYDGVGQLTKVTLPDGSFLSYTYDAAHRLTGLQDNQGNRIAYTLDAMGNRTQEQVLDPANQLAQTRSRVYSPLNHLFQEIGAQNQTTEYGYDDQGNLTSVKDPLNRTTSNQYDALNRLRQVTDPGLGVTQYAYNGLDALTQVTDPRSLVTGYTVDGLGNLTLQASPDTGNTTNTYDAAGNLLTQTDAKGQVTTYAYDALNRVTLITFHDGSRQAYAYDQGANGIGRLASITETNAANQVTSVIAYAYEAHGRVASETRTVNGVQYALGYSYDAAGRLAGLTYPSGRTVTYAFDALGRVSAVSTTKDQTQAVVSNVAYHPFGGVKSFTLGNGQTYTRAYDQDGRIAAYTLGASQYAIGYDAASRIEFISDALNPANTNTYGYDALDRLTGAVTPGTPFAYSYDAVGNRTSKTVGSSTDTYTYSPSSNRIASITPGSGPVKSFIFDPNGSTTNDAVNTYAYDARGRMSQSTSVIGTTSYQVNALGQRIRKSNTQADTVFHYDTQGRLIAETDPGGTVKRELIYLGDLPVGVIQ